VERPLGRPIVRHITATGHTARCSSTKETIAAVAGRPPERNRWCYRLEDLDGSLLLDQARCKTYAAERWESARAQMSGGNLDITVEEAAHRLGISVATVKRRLSAGQLAGRKIGRLWVVDGSRLPAPTRTSGTSPASAAGQDLVKALLHLRRTDLNELWVPDVLTWADHIAFPNPVLLEAAERASTGRCDAATQLEVPKTPILTRPVVLLALEDRIAYQSVVAALLPIIESRLSDRVYSSRASTSAGYFFRKSTEQWVRWHKRVRVEANSGFGWIAKTDLTAYFESIDHSILLGELASAGAPAQLLSPLRSFLAAWSRTPGRGLPQGPNASRALGNFYMAAVDEELLAGGANYWRYMDDVMIVAVSKADAQAAMRLFEQSCRRRGLIISSTKTELVSGARALAERTDPRRTEAQYLMDSSQDAKARRALRDILKESLREDGNIDVGATKFSLWRLAQLVDRPRLKAVLARLEDLGPVASITAAYVRLFIARPEVELALTEFIEDQTRNTSAVTESWLFACMVEHPGPLPTGWVGRARTVAQDRNGVSFHRTLATGVMALGMQPADHAWIKTELRREFEPDILRGHLVALARVGMLDRSTASNVAMRSQGLQATVDYLHNRNALPSLVWRGKSVKVK
jgi:excisionase family DNA binding protein